MIVCVYIYVGVCVCKCVRKYAFITTANDIYLFSTFSYVKVFDIKTKAVLRNSKGHGDAVRSTQWSMTGLHYLSASDGMRTSLLAPELKYLSYHSYYYKNTHIDCAVKLWDLPEQQVMWSAGGGVGMIEGNGESRSRGSHGHTDYVRFLSVLILSFLFFSFLFHILLMF